MRGFTMLAAAAAVLFSAAAPARACDINVRESGYIANSGQPYGPRAYMIWFLCAKETPEAKAAAARVDKLAAGELAVSNLAGDILAVDALTADERKDLEGRGIDLKKLPSCAVGRPAKDGAEILQVTPGTLDDAAVKALVLCPQKVALGKLLADPGNYCVLLFSPGKDAKGSAAALAVVNEAIADHAAKKPSQKMPVLTIDRAAPADAFFLAELGLKADGEAPFAAVVFGLGCLLQPPFVGADITKDALASQFAFLNHNASDCGADAVFVRDATADLLMRWDAARLDKIAEELAKAAADDVASGLLNPQTPPDQAQAPIDPNAPPTARQTTPTKATPTKAGPAKSAPAQAATGLGSLPTILLVVAGVLVLVAVGFWLALRGKPSAG